MRLLLLDPKPRIPVPEKALRQYIGYRKGFSVVVSFRENFANGSVPVVGRVIIKRVIKRGVISLF